MLSRTQGTEFELHSYTINGSSCLPLVLFWLRSLLTRHVVSGIYKWTEVLRESGSKILCYPFKFLLVDFVNLLT